MTPETVNIHDAKTNLSKIIDEVVSTGVEKIIAKAGRPMVKVIPYTETPQKRIGMLDGMYPSVPADIDAQFKDDIEAMFNV
ncbi:type II toxin-antitoxin system Phd/YefM family antitoxin [Pseudomonas luteola]|uniref:type II toxin-antitoxin system Phd/YefM family antitoxin n=1 Tax=Pseudomonas luteola TaxID=47886 RepID=UPI00123A0A9E|nr:MULTISPECIES: type II toxin-antitoxin system prevent-host-death family antitoxin [Pseudomonas]MBA1246183.1 type II toxin-antitoxin system prevent-host-death family antitoxin [Pseudomonas zeshuii]QEU26891.1 type II toxin-antitoxin system prevent-host-death family antitoxin [Pseudomonas luteola]